MNGKFYKKITGYFYLKDSVGNKTKQVKKHYKKKTQTELNRQDKREENIFNESD